MRSSNRFTARSTAVAIACCRTTTWTSPPCTRAWSGARHLRQDTHSYDWKNVPKPKKTSFPKGTVIVDVLQPKTHVLLWRGQTVAGIA